MISIHRCDTCHKSFKAPGGLRQHFKCHDNCRMNAPEGAYSIRKDRKIKFPNRHLYRHQAQQQQQVEPDATAAATAVILVNESDLSENFITSDMADASDLTLVEVPQGTEEFGVIQQTGQTIILRSFQPPTAEARPS